VKAFQGGDSPHLVCARGARDRGARHGARDRGAAHGARDRGARRGARDRLHPAPASISSSNQHFMLRLTALS